MHFRNKKQDSIKLDSYQDSLFHPYSTYFMFFPFIILKWSLSLLGVVFPLSNYIILQVFCYWIEEKKIFNHLCPYFICSLKYISEGKLYFWKSWTVISWQQYWLLWQVVWPDNCILKNKQLILRPCYLCWNFLSVVPVPRIACPWTVGHIFFYQFHFKAMQFELHLC